MSHKSSQMKKDLEYRELLEEQLRLRDRVFSAQERFRDALASLNIALDELSTSDKRVLEVYSNLEESVDHDPEITSEMIENFQEPTPKDPTPKVQGLSSRWISNKIRLPPPQASYISRTPGDVKPYITEEDIAWCNGWSSTQTKRLMSHLSEADPNTFKKW